MSSNNPPSSPSDGNGSDSNKKITVVAKMSLYLTDDGKVLIDKGDIVDIGKRIEMLRAVLQAEESELNAFLTKSPNSGYYC